MSVYGDQKLTDRNRELKKWAMNSAFLEDGLPRMWFHGTDEDRPFNIFTRWDDDYSLGFHFGSKEAANDRLAQMYRMGPIIEGVIIPVFCRARSPLRLPDLYTWGQSTLVDALFDKGVITDGIANYIEESCSVVPIFAAIEEAGYDCVVYSNLCEHHEEPTDSIFVWRSELLKSPFASSFRTHDPRLLPQNPTSSEDMRNWEMLGMEIATEREVIRSIRAETLSGSLPAFSAA